MPEPIKPEGGAEALVVDAPAVDAFGEVIKKEGAEVPEVKVVAPNEGGDKGGEDKGGEKLTPTQQIAELSRKIGEYAEKEKNWG